MKWHSLGTCARLRDARARPVLALIGAANLVGSILGIFFVLRAEIQPEANLVIGHAAAAEPKFDVRAHPVLQPVRNISFEDESGASLNLTSFRGKVVHLSIWAAWCPPCRNEMPGPDRLQHRLGGKDFEVVAPSIDRGGVPVAHKFFDGIGVSAVAIYVNRSAAESGELSVVAIPTTLLIDRAGKESGRLRGPA